MLEHLERKFNTVLSNAADYEQVLRQAATGVQHHAMNIQRALQLLAERQGSELFITVGYPPCLKLNKQLVPIGKSPLTTQQVAQALQAIMAPDRFKAFSTTWESNYAYHLPGTGRFRVSAFYQKGEPGMVIRRIHTTIPTLAELKLPTSLEQHVLQERGLILFIGPAGSGKTTSLAALIGHRNRVGKGHIITIEDPIEYIHHHGNCLVTQRDVGLDTVSYEQGLANALRQAPDVMVIGEVRSSQVMKQALHCVETGHLCMATLHANNTYQALERIVQFFPQAHRPQLLMDLSLNMKMIVGQQLVASKDKGTVNPVVEILLNTPRIADLIKKGRIDEVSEVMTKSQEQGMQTFDQSLYQLYTAGHITYEQAMLHATSANDLRLMIKLRDGAPRATEPAVRQLRVRDD